MKKIGIIGGLSAESSVEYYRKVTRKANEYLGGHNTVQVMMASVNTGDIIEAIDHDDWLKASRILIAASQQLEKIGADFIIIPCNTMHKIADEIQKNISIPLLNVMDCVGKYINDKNYQKVILLGTRFTMDHNFYREYLHKNFNIETRIPNEVDKNKLDKIIFNELCLGKIRESSKMFLIDLCHELYLTHACQAVILGCSEIPLLINQNDVDIELIDTVKIHSECAVRFALERRKSEPN